MKRFWIFVLMVPGLFIVGLLMLFAFAVLSFFPAYLTFTALAVMAVIGVWFWFSRRGSSSLIAGSETALLGRQTSKEGLL